MNITDLSKAGSYAEAWLNGTAVFVTVLNDGRLELVINYGHAITGEIINLNAKITDNEIVIIDTPSETISKLIEIGFIERNEDTYTTIFHQLPYVKCVAVKGDTKRSIELVMTQESTALSIADTDGDVLTVDEVQVVDDNTFVFKKATLALGLLLGSAVISHTGNTSLRPKYYVNSEILKEMFNKVQAQSGSLFAKSNLF